MHFKMSRWHYWWAYALIIVLALMSIWLVDRAFDASAWIVGSLALGFLIVCEMAIRWQRVTVTPKNVVIKNGLWNPMKTTLSYDSFGRVDVRQMPMHKALKMGDVIIHRPGGHNIGLHGMGYPTKLKKLLLKHLKEAHAHHKHGEAQ